VAQPKLLHPIRVTIQPFVEAAQVYDDDAREDIPGNVSAGAAGQPFTIPAQVQWGREDDPRAMQAGIREESSGYILVRYLDMDRLGVTIQRGDVITTIGKRSGYDLHIDGKEDCGHYPDQQGATLVRFYFTDRAPARVA